MFTLPDLPYAYDGLEPFIDQATMLLHHDKHHATYVQKLNDALQGHDDLLYMEIHELLKNFSQVPEEIKTKVKNHGGGHANHSLFWQIMKPHGGEKSLNDSSSQPQVELLEALNRDFGSFAEFKKKLTEVATSHFGSGWGWLVVNNGKLEIYSTSNQDSPLMENKTPILGIDVWEHSYYLKYQNKRAEYIEAWWNTINWDKVAEFYSQAK